LSQPGTSDLDVLETRPTPAGDALARGIECAQPARQSDLHRLVAAWSDQLGQPVGRRRELAGAAARDSTHPSERTAAVEIGEAGDPIAARGDGGLDQRTGARRVRCDL